MSLFSLARPILRQSVLRGSRPTQSLFATSYSHLAARQPFSTFSPVSPHQRAFTKLAQNAFKMQSRGVASSVSGRPASQTPEQAAENIKEEVGNSATDIAKVIAGGNFTQDNVKPGQETFLNVTSSVASSVPTPYMVFGLMGGVPYVVASGMTCYLAYSAGLATSGVDTNIDPGVAITILDRAFNAQVTYGAVMLSFLGALHWGMEFSGMGGHKGYSRLALGAAPVIFAWPTLALAPTTALIAQWVGFTTLWWADLKATNAGWTPKWYSQYRFYLSILVGSCIIATLASTSYFGPVAGHGILTHDLELIRMQRKRSFPTVEGYVSGEIEAVPTGEDGDHYVQIRHKEKKEEGGDEGEKSEEN